MKTLLWGVHRAGEVTPLPGQISVQDTWTSSFPLFPSSDQQGYRGETGAISLVSLTLPLDNNYHLPCSVPWSFMYTLIFSNKNTLLEVNNRCYIFCNKLGKSYRQMQFSRASVTGENGMLLKACVREWDGSYPKCVSHQMQANDNFTFAGRIRNDPVAPS